MVTVVKSYQFPVSVEWDAGRLVRCHAATKPDIEVATPPEFRSGIAGVWSAEDLLVASVASSFALMMEAVAERSFMTLDSLDVRGVGHVEAGEDGRFRFLEVELVVRVETANRDRLAELVHQARERAIVALALDVPLRVELVSEPLASKAG